MTRPKLVPHTAFIDKLTESISIVVLFLMILVPFLTFGKLPDLIPLHYDLSGNPDALGNKWSVFIIPAIALLSYIGLTILQKYPYVFNYPVEVTEKNATQLYRIGVNTIRQVKLITLLMFLTILYPTVQSYFHQGSQDFTLNGSVLVLLILTMSSILIIAIVKMNKAGS